MIEKVNKPRGVGFGTGGFMCGARPLKELASEAPPGETWIIVCEHGRLCPSSVCVGVSTDQAKENPLPRKATPGARGSASVSLFLRAFRHCCAKKTRNPFEFFYCVVPVVVIINLCQVSK